jgi:hypothetical protein
MDKNKIILVSEVRYNVGRAAYEARFTDNKHAVKWLHLPDYAKKVWIRVGEEAVNRYLNEASLYPIVTNSEEIT